MIDNKALSKLANSIRILSADAVEKAKSGHPGTPVGAADIIATLFANFLEIDPKNPTWINRDRFVLSAGHAAMIQYAPLYLLGYEKFNLEQIKTLRQKGSRTSGHPEIEHDAGIETTTGPLGEGVSMAVGMALAERMLNAKFNDLINHYTYAFVGDGCLMEGVSYEALSLAGHLNLNKLIVIYDKNDITIDGELSVASSENVALRMEAFGFYVQNIDGHNFDEIQKAIENAKKSTKPSFILAKTKIAKYAGNKEGLEVSHGSPLGAETIANLRKNIGWEYNEPFYIPDDIKNIWKEVALKNNKISNEWENKLSQHSNKDKLLNFINNKIDENLYKDLENLANDAIAQKLNTATRVTSSKVLEVLTKNLPFIIGGSADLSGSNNTIHKSSISITPNNYSGNYIHYGVREHAMGAIMNGLASYGGGFIPYGGTFFTFSDFLRPAIRLSALMHRQLAYVFTHDSIALGGDGPTHQPIEHLASLSLIPNTEVLRPADMIETIESYLIMLENKKTPTSLILGRANTITLRASYNKNENKVKLGAYVIYENEKAKINLYSSGSELQILFAVKDILAKKNIDVRIISVPAFNRFKKQTKEYINTIVKNPNNLNIVIEASSLIGWHEIIGSKTLYYGIDTFGISANPEDVLDYFGFTPEKIAEFILKQV
jgi:transketolase